MDELVVLAYCDLAGLVRGRAVPARAFDERRTSGVGWVPANQAICCFGPLGDHSARPERGPDQTTRLARRAVDAGARARPRPSRGEHRVARGARAQARLRPSPGCEDPHVERDRAASVGGRCRRHLLRDPGRGGGDDDAGVEGRCSSRASSGPRSSSASQLSTPVRAAWSSRPTTSATSPGWTRRHGVPGDRSRSSSTSRSAAAAPGSPSGPPPP